MFVEIIVALLNLGALGLLIYLVVTNADSITTANATRIPSSFFWVNYIIFSVVMFLASVGSMIMGIDDVRWYIRYKKDQDGRGEYEKMNVKHDEDL